MVMIKINLLVIMMGLKNNVMKGDVILEIVKVVLKERGPCDGFHFCTYEQPEITMVKIKYGSFYLIYRNLKLVIAIITSS